MKRRLQSGKIFANMDRLYACQILAAVAEEAPVAARTAANSRMGLMKIKSETIASSMLAGFLLSLGILNLGSFTKISMLETIGTAGVWACGVPLIVVALVIACWLMAEAFQKLWKRMQ